MIQEIPKKKFQKNKIILVPLYVYLALLNVYVYLQGGEGGQKWLKSCLRRKSMTPNS